MCFVHETRNVQRNSILMICVTIEDFLPVTMANYLQIVAISATLSIKIFNRHKLDLKRTHT